MGDHFTPKVAAVFKLQFQEQPPEEGLHQADPGEAGDKHWPRCRLTVLIGSLLIAPERRSTDEARSIHTPLAWHYTIAMYLPAIIESGVLRPATANVPANERPVVWFSMNQDFEVTARKRWRDLEGNERALSVAETALRGGGLVRLGIEPRRLLNGDKLRRAARISSETWRALCAAGRKEGADPTDWFGHVGEISVFGLAVAHRMTISSEWQSGLPPCEALQTS
ncbi:MAG: hypothetical protein U1F15_15375 [Burkholderiales bacterium]